MHNHFIDQIEWPACWVIDHDKRFLILTSASDFDTRTRLVRNTIRQDHDISKVPALSYWKNEEFPLYYPPTGENVLDMDGWGVDMFGIISHSVHMTGWARQLDGDIKIWVLRRARTKMSFPGMLDTTVGGSLAAGEKPIDGIVRESEEELSRSGIYTRPHPSMRHQLVPVDSLRPSRAFLPAPGPASL